MVDNSTQSVSVTRSGVGWTVDVTNCNLSTDLTVKDFIVEFSGIVQSNSNFTKTSSTLLTYTGGSISSTTVTVFRDTDVARVQEVTYADRITSSLWENEFNRIHRILSESNAFIRLDESPVSTDDSKKVATTEWVRDLVGTADSVSILDTIDVGLVAEGKPDGGTVRIVVVQGKTTSDDGRGGLFWWDESDTTTTADNIDVVLVDSNSANGRWKRLHQRIEALQVNDTLAVEGNTTLAGATQTIRGSIVNDAGNVTVGDTFNVTGASTLGGAITGSSSLTLTGAASLNSTLAVTGNTTLAGASTLIRGAISNDTGNVNIGDTLSVSGASTLTGAVTTSSTLNVAGNTTIGGALNVVGNISDSGGNVTIADNLDVTGTMSVTGASTLTGAVTAQNSLAVSGASTLSGAVSAASTLAVTGNSTLAGASAIIRGTISNDIGNVTIGDTLDVTAVVLGGGQTLSTYQHGSWAPTTAGDATGVITGASGFYVRIGLLVYCIGAFTVTTNFTSNTVGGLPFAAGTFLTGTASEVVGSAIVSTTGDLHILNTESANTFRFFAGTSSVAHNPNTTNGLYRFALTYIA